MHSIYTKWNKAIEDDDVDTLKLLAKDNPELIDRENVSEDTTSLMQAIDCKSKEAAKFLIESGADINSHDDRFWTPASFAVYNEMNEILNILLERGAEINANDAEGDTLVHLAAYQNNSDAIYILAEKGADLNLFNTSDSTPLMVAIEQESKDVFETLIDAGADIDAINDVGESAIFSAAYSEDELYFDYLIHKGANPRKKNDKRQSIVHIAASYSNSYVLHQCLKHTNHINDLDIHNKSPLLTAVIEGKDFNAKFLIENGADINIRHDNRTIKELANDYQLNETLYTLRKIEKNMVEEAVTNFKEKLPEKNKVRI